MSMNSLKYFKGISNPENHIIFLSGNKNIVMIIINNKMFG